jgi:hypothetical protein
VALFVALVVGHDAIRELRGGTRSPRQTLLWSACGFAGFFGPILLLRITEQLPMERIWLWNYRNHAGFYDQFPRTYWQWLLVNPLELTIASGAPIIIAALAGGRRLIAGRQWPPLIRQAAFWGTAVWGLLWLTGKNSGEAARLWLLFLPGLVALAAVGLSSASGTMSSPLRDKPAGNNPLPQPLLPILWLALQLAVAILTVHRVGGFHFEGQ